ncbi:bifunctional DNA primase/polymerase [Streptomyces sp. FXY-T5]|uniref:bifunctional DNA primase/polymerase n=1 Tax=Streptomyces sp. FXY-T5 TaxID=3064901 RepID=UPI0027D32FF9|nr:bifunctional DNA primase/polymerase [Streptomyces sp. FXY-T5]WMD03208.1 bifunctional DNA primase/polymerase [Streptomyces sp. FXY-T5]
MTSIPSASLECLPQLASALAAAERGWPVIPLRPGSKRPAGHAERACPGTGRCAGGHRTPEERATTDPDLIHAAWAHRLYNVGIATGPAGLLVIDLDVCKPQEPEGAPDGATSLQALCERAGQALPDTYRVRTARGGEHLYFTAPRGVRLRNSTNRLGAHIDTRAWGGYVVAPGSTTPDGTYTVLDDRNPATLPEWLSAALRSKPKRANYAMAIFTKCHSGYAAAALRGEVRNVATAADGTRNATLLRAARALGRLIASGDLDRTEVEQALSRAAAGNATQSQRYYDDVITRGLDWSIAHNSAGGRAA